MFTARAMASFFVLAVLSVPAPGADAVAPPADDETLVYVLREGGGGKVWLAVNDQTVGRLKNRSYEIVRANAGLVTVNIAISGIPKAAIALDDRAGETVYIKWELAERHFTEIDEAEALQFIEKHKRTDPIDEVQENNEEIRVLMDLGNMGFDLMQPAEKRLAPDEHHAVVTLFRPQKKAFMVTGIWGEQGYLGTLEAGQGIEVLLPEGEHYFLTGSVGTAMLRARVEAGKRYYAWLDIGGRSQLKPIGPKDAKKALKWMEGMEYVQLDPALVTSRVQERERIVLAHFSKRAAGARNGDRVHQDLGPEHALEL